MSSERKVLVTGATGKQGRALIHALKGSSFQVLALTRDASSSTANVLKSEPHVHVIQGDLNSQESVRKIFTDAGGKGSIWGVFMVLAFPGLGESTEGEAQQGITLADISLEYGVSVFIYSSAERGGEVHDDNPQIMGLDHSGKVKIERHVKALGEQGLRWTILRPAFFMETYEGTIGRITVCVLKCGLKPDTKVQLIAVSDIGQVAAAIFKEPESTVNKILMLAGDVLTMVEQDAAYLKGTGKHVPAIPTFLGRVILAMNSAPKNVVHYLEQQHQIRSENPTPFDEQLALTKSIYPNLTTFEQWAKEREKEVKEQPKGWNHVSLTKLLTGRQ